MKGQGRETGTTTNGRPGPVIRFTKRKQKKIKRRNQAMLSNKRNAWKQRFGKSTGRKNERVDESDSNASDVSGETTVTDVVVLEELRIHQVDTFDILGFIASIRIFDTTDPVGFHFNSDDRMAVKLLLYWFDMHAIFCFTI